MLRIAHIYDDSERNCYNFYMQRHTEDLFFTHVMCREVGAVEFMSELHGRCHE